MTSVPDSSLEAGLAALKKGDYPTAIAHLKQVCEVELDNATILRAQMALVVAYQRSGNGQQALTLCQQLSKSSNAQVKQWAVKTLAGLKNYPSETSEEEAQKNPEAISAPETSSSADTGFVPLTPGTRSISTRTSVPSTASASSTEAPQADASGFVPLDSTSQTSQAASRPTGSTNSPASSAGFVPLKNTTDKSSSAQSSPKKQEEKLSSAANTTSLGRSQESNHEPLRKPNTAVERKTLKPTPTLSTLPKEPEWKQAGRLQRWQSLPTSIGFKPKAIQLLGVQLVTAIALFWLLRFTLQLIASTTNNLLVKLPYLNPIQGLYNFYYNPTWPLLIGLLILLVVSPWLMEGLLRLFYGLKRLPLETLQTQSPEAVKVLQRLSRERRLPLPKLGILPTGAPIIFTYGNFPLTAQIVVSQGLLDQLAEDEIATVYAGQFGHIIRWDFILMSFGALVVQLPYIVYWQVAQWGEQWEGFILRGTAGAIASLSYGLYWLLRWPLVWLSRLRIYYSDHFATEVTGNPNGLTRALLKIAIGMAQDIEKQGRTSWLLESFDLLMPLGHRQAVTLGSLYPYTSWEPLLTWDFTNPYRQWLALNNFHPLTGDRLQLLARYARYWKLETELNFRLDSSPSLQHSKFFLQAAPYLGILIGCILGGLLWLAGGIGELMRIRLLSWLLEDYWWFLIGFVLAGFSIGTFIRINSFFPDIIPSTRPDELTLPNQLSDPNVLPITSPPLRLQGKLLGRPGISNWLGQDLIFQSHTGLVKLHHLSWLGPIGNLLAQLPRPSALVNQPVIVTGWFRRGATAWIDLEMLRTPAGKTSQSNHPVWSTIVAFIAAAWGAYIILRGGL